MLVLTRKVGEQIVIDGNIIVTVVGMDGNKIRLGITAPRSCPVDRAEVHERRMSEEAIQPRASAAGPSLTPPASQTRNASRSAQ